MSLKKPETYRGPAMKDWQRGYPFEVLEDVANVFKRNHAKFVFGRFGMVTERDVAEYGEKQQVTLVRDDPTQALWSASHSGWPSKVRGAALWTILSRPSKRADFRGEPIHVPSGAVMVRAIAADTESHARRLIKKLMGLGSGLVYLEVYEEDKVMARAINTIEASWRGTIVTAGSSIRGIYALPSNQIDMIEASEYMTSMPSAELPNVAKMSPLDVDPDTMSALAAEVYAGAEWAQHYSPYNKRKSWTAYSLRGYSERPDFIIKPAEMSKRWKAENPDLADADVAWCPGVHERFPVTMSIVRAIQGNRPDSALQRVRLMRLEGGGELGRHADITDREAGVADGKVARFHFPIVTSKQCVFNTWCIRGHMMVTHMNPGEVYYLDTRKPHAVKNASKTDRIHLVVDMYSDEELRDQVRFGW